MLFVAYTVYLCHCVAQPFCRKKGKIEVKRKKERKKKKGKKKKEKGKKEGH